VAVARGLITRGEVHLVRLDPTLAVKSGRRALVWSFRRTN